MRSGEKRKKKPVNLIMMRRKKVSHCWATLIEVRVKAAGQYQFSMDEEERARQMQELKEGRLETEKARERVRTALNTRNERLEARNALLETKRIEMAGGKEALENIRSQQRAEAADNFLNELGLDLAKP